MLPRVSAGTLALPFVLPFLCACGASSTTNGATSDGGYDAPSGGGEYLTWIGSTSGDVVLDANGNAFVFEASTGCAYGRVTDVGPQGFCLTPSGSSPTGYVAYGPTDCSTPSTNTECSVAGFSVTLTQNPAGSGCIAVLADGSATVSVGLQSLAVTSVAAGFTITTTAAPTAYKAYWNGVIPLCGLSNPFAGSYAGNVWAWDCPAGSTLSSSQGTPAAPVCNQSGTTVPAVAQTASSSTLSFTIDSGGQLDDDATKVSGVAEAGGVGTVIAVSGRGSYTVTTATQGSGGKWTLGGIPAASEPGLFYTFSVAEQ